MDAIPDNSNNQHRSNQTIASKKMISLERSLDQTLPSAQEITELRRSLRKNLERASKPLKNRSPVIDTPEAVKIHIDSDSNLRQETLSFLRRLSNPKLDTELRKQMTRDFLDHGFFQEPKNARQLSSFLHAILFNGQASFFRDQEIDKKQFAAFLIKARKVEPSLLSDLIIGKPNERAFENLVLLLNETKAPKQKIAKLFLKNLFETKDRLSDQEVKNLTMNMDRFFGDKKKFTAVLRSVISKAQDRSEGLLTSIVNEGVNISYYQEQMEINNHSEEPAFMFDSESDLLDDPEILIKKSQENATALVEKYNSQKHILDASHNLLRSVLKKDIERVNARDLVALLDYFKVDIAALGQLSGSELEDLDIFNEFRVNLFGQKSFADFTETLNLIARIPDDNSEVNSEDKFKLLSDLHYEMNDEAFLNSRFNLVSAARLIEIDPEKATQFFLEMLDDFSPYANSYDNFQFRAEFLSYQDDKKTQDLILKHLLEEYELQMKFKPEGRSLPLLLAFMDHALDHADVMVKEDGTQVLIEPRKQLPVLRRFLQNANVDFSVMIPMLENAVENFNDAEEENFSMISRQVSNFSSLGFDGEYDDSALLVNQKPELLLQKFIQAVSYQTSRKQEPKDDIITIKLLQYLHSLSATDPDKIASFKGPAKHFVDQQMRLAGVVKD
jgi:hypothetical protein